MSVDGPAYDEFVVGRGPVLLRFADTFAAHEADAPTGAGLLPAVRARVARRRHRTWVVAGLSATAVVALIATLAVVLPGRDRSTAELTGPQPPTSRTGEQWVSYHGAQLLVPASWKVDDAVCGTPQHDTVMIPGGAVDLCLVPQPAGITVVQMSPADWPLGKARAALATEPVTVDGQPARRGSGTALGQRGPVQVLLLPSVNVVISVEGPDPALAERILDSTRLAVPVDVNGCSAQIDSLVPPISGSAGHPTSLEIGSPVKASLCWYDDGWLNRSVQLSPAELQQLVGILRALPTSDGGGAPGANPAACGELDRGFLLQLTSKDGSTNDVYIHVGCRNAYAATPGYATKLSNALVRFVVTKTGYSGPVPDPATLP